MAWSIQEKDLKRYPHFDKHLSVSEIEAIVTDPARVTKNAFYPFLCYEQEWQPFRKLESRPDKKSRLIRYASRRDAQIFSYYRHLLSAPYEAALLELNIDNCPIAYRKIRLQDSNRGKCNIDFANDAFQAVRDLGNCCAITLDISKFFECIDHQRLLSLWCRLLKVEKLPADHFAVYRAITRYAVVDRNAAYERLGYIGSRKRKNGAVTKGFLVPAHKMPWQLCSPSDFRKKICGDLPEFSSLIKKNKYPYGIPQGAPISDLLANLYLIDFDHAVADYVREREGFYYRYSDDFLILVPGDKAAGSPAKKFVMDLVGEYGDQLRIKEEKTSMVEFRSDNSGAQTAAWVGGRQGKNGLEYLGFRFDGENVFLRDSTLSRFHRKIVYAARREARKIVAKYQGKGLEFLVEIFDMEQFCSRFGRVEDFEDNTEYQKWTFWTYANRSAQIFGTSGHKIYRQLRRHREFIRRSVTHELARAIATTDKAEVN